MKNTKPLTVDRPTLARVLGVSVRSIDRLETSGILVPVGKPRRGTPSRYDLVIAVPAFIESKLAPLDARESSRDRYYDAQAELSRLKLARERGDLLDRSKVIAEGQTALAAVKAALLRIPRELVMRGLIQREVESDVRELITDALRELSQWRNVSDADAALAAAKE